MSYSGVRRRSVGAGLAGMIANLATFVIFFWLMFRTARAATSLTDIVWVEAALFGSFFLAVVVHESGHLIVGLVSGEPVRMMRVGSGGTLVAFRVKGLTLQLCANPLGGGAVYFSEVGAAPGRVHIGSLAAGPGFNLLAAVYAFGLYTSGVDWLALFGIANLMCFLTNITPSSTVSGGRSHETDGLKIYNLLFRPQAPVVDFEGAELMPDARAVLVAAAEDAQLSGLDEVTDMHLLRALAKDASVGALFAASGLTARIPLPKIPDSDDLVPARFGPAVNAVLTTSFHKARDMGIGKPNAAMLGLCLLVSNTEAAALMKQAGITEEGLRRLASVATVDEEAARRELVITPDLPLERWGAAADRVLAYAYRIAAADRSSMLGSQHLLAAMVADPGCRAAQALSRMGFVLVWNEQRRPAEDAPADGEPPPLSPQAALAIAGALWRTGPTFPTGTAELCLGILDQAAGIGSQILASAHVTVDGFVKALRYTAPEISELAGCTAASHGMWSVRASARIGAGRWLDARADFLQDERACVSERQRAYCRNNAAWVSLMSGDPSLHRESLELARAALAVLPDRPAAKGTYAFALLENGSPAEAIAIFDANLPNIARPRDRALELCAMAMCRARLGQPAVAHEHLAAALLADPKCPLLARAQAQLSSAPAAIA